MITLTLLDRLEEAAIRRYHADTEYTAEECENRPQPPRATREEVTDEIDFALMTSIMVGVPG
jgi:hypothetical protein